MDKPCLFCEIAHGRVPASFVMREPGVAAFLDARPLFQGHVLVIPVVHAGTFLDAPAAALGALFAAVQRVAAALERGLGADGSLVAVNVKVSQSVPHLHVHVVPRRKGDGLRGFFWPRSRYETDAARDDVARRIAAALPPPSDSLPEGGRPWNEP